MMEKCIYIYVFMMHCCPEVAIKCHKNPVNGNVSVSLQKSAAVVHDLSGKKCTNCAESLKCGNFHHVGMAR